jgi:hypothetical protein
LQTECRMRPFKPEAWLAAFRRRLKLAAASETAVKQLRRVGVITHLV